MLCLENKSEIKSKRNSSFNFSYPTVKYFACFKHKISTFLYIYFFLKQDLVQHVVIK